MAKRPLKDVRKDKHKILTNAYRDFIESIKRAEKKIFSLFSVLIKTFNTQDDNIVDGVQTRRIIRGIKKELREFLQESALQNRVKNFTNNFDKVERLSTQIFARANNIPLSSVRNNLQVGDIKDLYIEQITEGLLSEGAIDVELINPIRQIVFNASTSGMKIGDAEKQIRQFLLGKGDKGGKLVNRARFFAVETIHRFNGAIQTELCKKFDAKVFKILNPLIKTSVENCVDMVEGTGEHGALAIAPRTYLIEDIPKIIRLNNKMGVSVPNTTPENYFILRNHFGCLHDFECVIMSDEKIAELKKKRDS